MSIVPLVPLWIYIPLALLLLVLCIVALIKNKTNRRPWIRRLVLAVVAILMLGGVQIPGGDARQVTTDLDVFVVIDKTLSMEAEDYDGTKTRLDGVRHDVRELLKELAGARFSVISFGNISYVELPLTTDGTGLQTHVDTIAGETVYYAKQTRLDSPVDLLKTTFKTHKKETPDRAILMVFMSDGEQTSDEDIGSYKSVKQYVDASIVLGYGTNKGGRMLENGYISEGRTPGYVKDNSTGAYPSPDALSKINEANLKTIAGQLDAQYLHRTKPDGLKVDLPRNTPLFDLESKKTGTYLPLYWVFASILTIGMMLEFAIIRDSLVKQLPQKPYSKGDGHE